MRRRTHFIGLWLDDTEYRHLCQQCSISGLTASAHIRKLIMKSQLRPRPPDELPRLLHQLSGIGNNVNQIARYVNARKCATDIDLRALAELVQEAHRLVKNTL